MKKITLKNFQVINLRRGLNLLDVLNGPRIGMLRVEIAEAIKPKLLALEAATKNDEFERVQQEIMLVDAPTDDERKDRIKEIERRNARILRDKFRQQKEYEKILEEEVELSIPQIPLSYLTKETPSAAYELLAPIIDKKK